MNSRLSSTKVDYAARIREALVRADDALRKKDIVFARQIINEMIFQENTARLNSTQELTLITILLGEFFVRDDPTNLPLFFNIFEVGKNSRKFILIKFIMLSIGIQSGPALNAVGTYLLDPSLKDIRIAADLNRLLINEITYCASNSMDKLKALPSLSPLFTNSLCLIFAESFKDDQLPTKIISELITDFLALTPFIYIFSVQTHIDTGSFLLCTFMRWTILSELYEAQPNSKLHLKILECLSSVDPNSPSKPIVYTKYIEGIADQIQRAVKIVEEPERIQRSMEKFAQLLQISKKFLYGNIPLLMDRIRQLPKNSLMELVLKHS